MRNGKPTPSVPGRRNDVTCQIEIAVSLVKLRSIITEVPRCHLSLRMSPSSVTYDVTCGVTCEIEIHYH